MQHKAGMNYAVIGAGYGDEGKGLLVDALCRRIVAAGHKSPFVVRHNGTAQATHTVVGINDYGEDVTHRFSHFGAGSIAMADTILWKTFFAHPAALFEETEALEVLTNLDDLYLVIHEDCPVVMPYDIALSQMRARRLGHGSCGMGMYPAFLREQKMPGLFSIKAMRELGDKLRIAVGHLAAAYYEQQLPREDRKEFNEIIERHDLLMKFFQGIELLFDGSKWNIKSNKEIIDLCRRYPLVFEGAQGLGLDPAYGQMPYCTPSHCGVKNPLAIMDEVNADGGGRSLEVNYVTRTYGTRHGAGPFLSGDDHVHLTGHRNRLGLMRELDHNSRNDFQGSMRYGPLDMEGMKARIWKDLIAGGSQDGYQARAGLFITWADALESEGALEELVRISDFMDLKLEGFSYGQTSEQVVMFGDHNAKSGYLDYLKALEVT